MQIVARDMGTPALSTTCNVTVNLLDENDNAPQFLNASIQVSVSENVELVDVVASGAAVDRDIGANANLVYSSRAMNTSLFSLNASSGSIRLLTALDFETIKQVSFDLTATDQGVPRQNATTVVEVNVIDVNDNAPQFEQAAYFIALRPDAVIGDLVGTVNAVDKDSGDNMVISYSLDSSSTFNISSLTGELYLSSDPQGHDFNVTVTAQDHGIPSLHTNVTITARVSLFENLQYSVKLPESIPPATRILAFVLDAPDSDLRVIEGNELGWISIQGVELHVNNTMDFRVAPMLHLRLGLYGANNSLQDTTIVNVELIDENASPTFLAQTSEARVSEAASIGTELTRILANDEDIGADGRLVFTLVNQSLPFNVTTVESNAGFVAVIRVVGALDREMTAQYTLQVVATDLAITPMSSTHRIQVGFELFVSFIHSSCKSTLSVSMM